MVGNNAPQRQKYREVSCAPVRTWHLSPVLVARLHMVQLEAVISNGTRFLQLETLRVCVHVSQVLCLVVCTSLRTVSSDLTPQLPDSSTLYSPTLLGSKRDKARCIWSHCSCEATAFRR